MTNEKLEEIRNRHNDTTTYNMLVESDLGNLLDEVDRLEVVKEDLEQEVNKWRADISNWDWS